METRWIWPFELLDKIGEGGMGVVYRARYVGNNRQVAVKLIPEEINSDSVLVARFERELEVLKQLHHPNIVQCFGGRCESKQRYYAMEYIPGGTLAEYLSNRKHVSWENVVDFAIQMCAALQHAHEHGVIHRDIKPGNFLLTKSGQLKLSDFGLASVVSEGRLTAAGRTVGTILYMAPEQIRGASLTHRADLYALGCVLFEMLSGFTPYTGASAAEVLQRHLKDPIPHVSRHVLDCPFELDELICDLLAKDPEHRPANAAVVSDRLNAILLPSRRGRVAEPDIFSAAGTVGGNKAMTIAPLKKIKPLESETEIPRVESKPRKSAWIPWIVSGIALLVCCQLWFAWAQSARHLREAEQVWVNLLDTADPATTVLAARGLSKFAYLSPSTISKLSSVATSSNAEIRLAALKTLQEHAAESRGIRAELLRIQKVDDNSMVRSEAAEAVKAISNAGRLFSLDRLVFCMIAIAMISAFAVAGRWVWKRVEPYAQ